MSFLLNVSKNFKLSPVYCTGVALSTAIFASDVKMNGTLTPRSAFAAFMIVCNAPMLTLNFYGYKRALALMQKHGYQDRIFKLYTHTFCGRQQVKLAAEEAGFKQAQKLHFEKINVKWYQFDSSPTLNIFLSSSEMAKIICLSQCLYMTLNEPAILSQKKNQR